MNRTEFLKEEAISGKNKCCRKPFPHISVAEEPCSLIERRALATVEIFRNMPVFIGEKELIVGTRTFFAPNKGNEDGHDIFEYGLETIVPYVNRHEVELFGDDYSYYNKKHYTPDFSIILDKGIDGIINDAQKRKEDPALHSVNQNFLSAVIIAYDGLKKMILRYADKAMELSQEARSEAEKAEILEVARICRKISSEKPDTFHEAIQLLWFAHLGTIIESFEFVCYGRLDVILGKYLKDTPRGKAQMLIECLVLKMYDQADLKTSYIGKYSGELVVTLGGILPDGENAVNEVTMMFLRAIDKIRLPEPEFNLRIHSKNPPEFLDEAARLTVSGCNNISYYNDDLFVNSLNMAGIPIEYARDYGFDLCQDINIPGRGDFYQLVYFSLTDVLMKVLKAKRDFASFEEFYSFYKADIESRIAVDVEKYNKAEEHINLYAAGRQDEFFDGIKNHNKPATWAGTSPMAPLPLLSPLYHGSIENALDIVFAPYPLKEKGIMYAVATEAINSVAAIKKTVFDDKRYSLDQVYQACESNYENAGGEYMRNILWNCPKWGNDDDYVDSIAKDLLEFCLKICKKHRTYSGGQVLGGIHQPHPVSTGESIMATPEGRKAGMPVSVTLTPESGTAKKGPTAILRSASKIDPSLVQWNYCVMVNYFASVFKGNDGKEIFKTLLKEYFNEGGLQHQPNISDVEQLKDAQINPGKYKDLIVRLWGVSAHFVDLPKKIQDEMIERFN